MSTFPLSIPSDRPWLNLEKNGKSKQPILPYSSVSQFLITQSTNYSDSTAIQFVHYGETAPSQLDQLTYEQLLNVVQQLSNFLIQDCHLRSGEAIALNLHNHPLLLLAHLAAWSVGLVTVPLDLLRDETSRKIYKMEQTNTKLLIADLQDAQFGSEVPELEKGIAGLKVVSVSEIEKMINKDVVSQFQLDGKETAFSLDQVGLVLFTSGTTALPKGVQLSPASVFLNADGIIDWLRIGTEDNMMTLLPLHHINSTTFCVAMLMAGGSITLCSRYSKSQFWQTAAENHCTLSSIVPTICFDLLSEQANYLKYQSQLAQLSRIQLGSAPVQPADVLEFQSKYHTRIVQGYGSTETALRVTGVPYGGMSPADEQRLISENAIGEELKWNQVQIMAENHDDNLSPLAEGEVGELCVRGPIVTGGYLQNPSENKVAFAGGWFHTGDLGYWRTIGGQTIFFTTGRRKEIIIKGGVNISPLAVENVIMQSCPLLASCYVVGVPDRRYGEVLAAVISFPADASVKDRQQITIQIQQDLPLQKYEQPSFVQEVPLTSLPKTSTGKVQRVKIKEYMANLLTPIAVTEEHIFRSLTPFDVRLIEQAVQIHNKRWGEHLGMTVAQLSQAVENGVVIGAVDRLTGELEGSLCAISTSSDKFTTPLPSWLRTYEGVSSQMTLKNHDNQGDSMLLLAVSTQGKPWTKVEQPKNYNQLVEVASKVINKYIASGLDPVLSFHQRPKAGLARGAEVVQVLEAARPEDYEACGYNVLVRYDLSQTSGSDPSTGIKVSPQARLGVQLVEAALVMAAKRGMKEAYAYTRPSGLLKWLLSQS